MNEAEIQKENIIERYLLHHLSEDKVDAFEEHLLFCEQCRDELEEMEELIGAVRVAAQQEDIRQPKYPATKHAAKKKPLTALNQYYRKHKTNVIGIAAVFLIFLVTIYYLGKMQDGRDNQITENIVDSLKQGNSSDTRTNEKQTNESEKEGNAVLIPSDKPPLARTEINPQESYSPNPYLEVYITDPVRTAYSVTFDSPRLSTIFPIDKNGNIKLLFEGTIQGIPISQDHTFHLKIFTNRESDYINDSPSIDVILPVKADVQQEVYPFRLNQSLKLSAGMYYFTLEYKDNDEPLYAGKFFVNKP